MGITGISKVMGTIDLRKNKEAAEREVLNPPITSELLKKAKKSKTRVEEIISKF